MSYSDPPDGDLNELDQDLYANARRMAHFLRGQARVAVALARVLAVFWALVGAFSFFEEGNIFALLICAVFAVLSWVSASPFAIVVRGLADLTDALVDIAINSSSAPAPATATAPAPAPAPAPASSSLESRRELAKRLAAEAMAKQKKG